ncbi:NADPH-dependent FMN reductase [Pseudomonas sp. M47T1]|uniref:NADPH-dependent FMN reductase n=1 Tax=unclassified Pseudomonas TaxID=196821 RepID=UPI0002607B15|nr:NADPH-dependent FMN reductase [Pseudomonas sp. M47T1]EIK96735.1 NADPH-dependent FMN reductase [Pseudomonas sp. M47T1]
MPHLLTLCGSLRQGSTNRALLDACEALCPPGLSIRHYRGLGQLPLFNPDLSDCAPPAVLDLQAKVAAANGLLIACPEYARGIPGAFKNALDWLVASEQFPGKPVALFNASPRASHAQAALRLVLDTLSARIVEGASVTVNLLSKGMTAGDIVADATLAETLDAALRHFHRAIKEGHCP